MALLILTSHFLGCGDNSDLQGVDAGAAPGIDAAPSACADAPCENDGICGAQGSSFVCLCTVGYAGPTCAQNADDCDPNPCFNGGACMDRVDGFICTCANGYSGVQCEINIDDCDPNPCFNSGTCIDGVDVYSCACATGYSDATCETNVDDCDPDPCFNGGVCTDSVNGYTCACVGGHAGVQCQTPPKTWGSLPPVTISPNNGWSAQPPQLAVDSAGNAVAVWTQFAVDISSHVWANRYTAVSGWGTAELIESGSNGQYPQVAMDSDGNAIAVWAQSGGIYANRRMVVGGWGPAELIGNGADVQIATDGAGNAVAVWMWSDGIRNNIWANRYVIGIGWGAATLIETDNAGDAAAPQVAIDSAGNAVAIWSQFDGARDNIWANRYVAGGAWGAATLVETDNAGSAGSSQVAMNDAGNAVAVWLQSDGVRNNLWANRYDVGVGWGTATLIEVDDAGSALSPQLTMDGAGNAVAVWAQNDGTRDNIWANHYLVGIGWGTATLGETGNAGNASNPQLAVDSTGDAVVVWSQFDGTLSSIWANGYWLGVGWGTAEPLSSSAINAVSPRVAVNGAGRAITLWRQRASFAAPWGIWARHRE